MYIGLVHTHSSLRYIVLLLLIIVIVKSFMGYTGKKPFQSIDNKLSLWLLITTHIQFLIGLLLYFQSPLVQFNEATMKNSELRYWAMEHVVGMLIAVVIITVARITSKKIADSTGKHRRLFIFNTLALIVIVATILQSGRKVFFFF